MNKDNDSSMLQSLWYVWGDELYIEIGHSLCGRTAFPMLPNILLKSLNDGCKRVLYNPCAAIIDWKAIASQEISIQELILLVSTILDIVMNKFETVPTVTVAALVVRIGIQKFCRYSWTSSGWWCWRERTLNAKRLCFAFSHYTTSTKNERMAGGSSFSGRAKSGSDRNRRDNRIEKMKEPHKRRSCSIMAPSHVRVAVRLHVMQLTGESGSPWAPNHPSGCRPCGSRGRHTEEGR